MWPSRTRYDRSALAEESLTQDGLTPTTTALFDVWMVRLRKFTKLSAFGRVTWKSGVRISNPSSSRIGVACWWGIFTVTSTSDILFVQVRRFGDFIGVEHVTGIRRAGTYKYPDSSFSLLPFHQAYSGTHECVPLVILGDNFDCDLITVPLVWYNFNLTSRLPSSSQNVDGTRIQWNVECQELRRRGWRPRSPPALNAMDGSPIFRFRLSNHLAGLGWKRPLQHSIQT